MQAALLENTDELLMGRIAHALKLAASMMMVSTVSLALQKWCACVDDASAARKALDAAFPGDV